MLPKLCKELLGVEQNKLSGCLKKEIYQALAERLHRNPIGNPVKMFFLRLWIWVERLSTSEMNLT